MIVNFISTHLLSHCLHKVQPSRLTYILFEDEDILFLPLLWRPRSWQSWGDYLERTWISLAVKLAISRRINLVADIDTYANGEMRPYTFGIHLPYFIYPEIFCFSSILKCRGSNILILCGRNVKARCALIQFLNPELLHIG